MKSNQYKHMNIGKDYEELTGYRDLCQNGNHCETFIPHEVYP